MTELSEAASTEGHTSSEKLSGRSPEPDSVTFGGRLAREHANLTSRCYKLTIWRTISALISCTNLSGNSWTDVLTLCQNTMSLC